MIKYMDGFIAPADWYPSTSYYTMTRMILPGTQDKQARAQFMARNVLSPFEHSKFVISSYLTPLTRVIRKEFSCG